MYSEDAKVVIKEQQREKERESGSGKWDAEQKEMRPETTGLIRAAAANDRKVVDFR